MRYNPTPYRPKSGERYVTEVQTAPAQPAQPALYRGRGPKRVLVRPAKPERPARYAAFGAMPTAPLNDAPHERGVEAPRVYDYGPLLGEYRPRMRRPKRPDGSRGRYVDPGGGRLLARASVDVEADARATVQRALRDGQFTHKGRCVRVVATGTGAVRTIPDKGAVLKWASAEDLAQAIATGAF